MMNPLLSSPKPPEEYIIHIERTKREFEIVYPIFKPVLVRILSASHEDIEEALQKMVIFHDIGKLTKRWQEIAEREAKENKNLHKPAHAPIGAAYIYKKLEKEEIAEELRNAVSFAVAIHHSDKGLLGDNIEKPDVQAIKDGIIDYSTNRIIWDKRVEKLPDEYFPIELKNLNVKDLTNMARGLRVWSRGCDILEQHKRRIQMSLVHHILKLCDISAASKRKEFQKEPDNPFGGWLMSIKIEKYMKRLKERVKNE